MDSMEYKWAQADPVVPVHLRQSAINAFLLFLISQWHEPVPLHQGVMLSLSTTLAVLCHTVYPTHLHIAVVWGCLNLRCLNTSLVTELTISDICQWSCLLANRFTVEVLSFYFCRYMAKWFSENFAFPSATYCGVQWGNHTGGATSCIK